MKIRINSNDPQDRKREKELSKLIQYHKKKSRLCVLDSNTKTKKELFVAK